MIMKDKKVNTPETDVQMGKKEKMSRAERLDAQIEEANSAIGKSRSFAVAEAHKRLRTNVLFSFPDESECRVIGVTSTMAHEGKSTTSINLAYDIAQTGKKVLLIDADMRLSRFTKVLGIKRTPGLSNLLVGAVSDEDHVIQHADMLDNLSIISCGSIPPNPSELLASKRMSALLETLKKAYKYIIIDLPPLLAVSDALIVSKLADGMLMVVRQDYVDKRYLDEVVRQLIYNDANIIGFVMTCAQREAKYYKKYNRKYKKYGYGKGYKDYYKDYYMEYAPRIEEGDAGK